MKIRSDRGSVFNNGNIFNILFDKLLDQHRHRILIYLPTKKFKLHHETCIALPRPNILSIIRAAIKIKNIWIADIEAITGLLFHCRNEKICTGKVTVFGPVRNKEAFSSPKDITKTNSTPAMTPEAISGRVIFVKMTKRFAPNVAAASSISMLTPDRLATTVRMIYGNPNNMWHMRIDIKDPLSDRLTKKFSKEIPMMIDGIRIGESKYISIMFLYLNSYRTIA
jgi:hypothetical protein